MLNKNEKSQNLFGWLLEKFNDFKSKQLKYHESLWDWFKYELNSKFGRGLKHKITMAYYSVRNYERWIRIGDRTSYDGRRSRVDIVWELRKPLTLTFIQEDKGYCPTCHARAVENGDAYDDEYNKFNHARYNHWYETDLLLKNEKYTHTSCHCDKLLFEPLDNWYNSGGDEGNPLATQDCAQWDINKEIRVKEWWKLDKVHQVQVLPKDWSRYDN